MTYSFDIYVLNQIDQQYQFAKAMNNSNRLTYTKQQMTVFEKILDRSKLEVIRSYYDQCMMAEEPQSLLHQQDTEDKKMKEFIEEFDQLLTISEKNVPDVIQLSNEDLNQKPKLPAEPKDHQMKKYQQPWFQDTNDIGQLYEHTRNTFIRLLKDSQNALTKRAKPHYHTVKQIKSLYRKGKLIFLVVIVGGEDEKHVLISIKEMKRSFPNQLYAFLERCLQVFEDKLAIQEKKSDINERLTFIRELFGSRWALMEPESRIVSGSSEVFLSNQLKEIEPNITHFLGERTEMKDETMSEKKATIEMKE